MRPWLPQRDQLFLQAQRFAVIRSAEIEVLDHKPRFNCSQLVCGQLVQFVARIW